MPTAVKAFLTLSRKCALARSFLWRSFVTASQSAFLHSMKVEFPFFSPIHFDGKIQTIDAREFNEPINLFVDIYGQPPFGTLLGTNAPGSTKTAFGGPEEQHWKTFDQTGNWRDHQYHWLLTDIYHDENPVPAKIQGFYLCWYRCPAGIQAF